MELFGKFCIILKKNVTDSKYETIPQKENAERTTRRFCEMAAVTPQKRQCLIASSSPAASLLSAATSQSRWDVVGNFGQVRAYLTT
jgi:hypothetical protein